MTRLCWLSVVAASFFIIQASNAQTTSPTGPTHPNIARNCNAFYTVVAGDGCWSVETSFGITHANFILWNPDVSDDCVSNFWLGSSYCVGVGAVVSSSTTTSRTTTTTSQSITTSSILSTTRSSTISSTRSSSITITATVNATYSIREPIVTWNVTTTQAETLFPPQKTAAGQPTYCINWHLVIAGETCEDVVGSATWATMEQFHQWNPSVGKDCSGLYDGWWVCIAIQPQSVTVTFDYTLTAVPGEVPDPTPHTPTLLTPANSTFIASPTQAGVAPSCKAFYQAKDGDTCRQLLAFGLFTQEQFFSWNPALSGNCDGLWLGYYYCVAAGDSLPAPPTTTTKPASVPPGQTSTCVRWYQVGDETCDEIVDIFGTFSKTNLISWNPSVGSNCADIVPDDFVCVGVPGTPTTRTAAVPTTSFPIDPPKQSGIASDCTNLWLVSSTDTCSSIAMSNSITLAQLLAWNPAVGTTTCDNLKQNFYVCVAVKGTSITTTGPSTSSPTTISSAATSRSISSTTTASAGGAVTTPAPIQGGMVAGCRRFYLAQSGDGCWAIANSAGILLDDFYAWNPAVGTSCAGLWLDTYYCIGIAGPVTTITSGPPVPTS